MAKKSRKRIDSSQSTPMMIDYDKLAHCIAKAIAEENEKENKQYSATRELLKFVLTPILFLVSLLSLVIGIVLSVYTFSHINTGNIYEMATSMIVFISGLACFSIAVISFMAGKEIDKETDRQFVVAVFSGVVALIALVISIISLVK